MHHRISLTLGVGLLGVIAWTAFGNGPSVRFGSGDDSVTINNVASDGEVGAGASTIADVVDDELEPPSTTDVRGGDLSEVVPTQDSSARRATAPSSQPSSRPVEPATPQGNRARRFNNSDPNFGPRGRRAGMGSMAQGGWAGNGRPGFNEEEVDRARPEADQFWHDNSPERYKAMQRLQSGPKLAMQTATTRMYLGFRQFSEKDPELYNTIVQRVKAEDNVFGLVSALKKSGEDAKASKPLREAIESLVKLNLKERHLRLDELEKTLKEQKDTLTADEDPANLNNLVENRLDSEINQHGYKNRPHSRPGGPVDPSSP
jgi:hypothetical protein